MHKAAKIYIAGHLGMVGSALVRALAGSGHSNLLTRTSRELDLTRQCDVEEFFSLEKPEYVFIAAAKVGGLMANKTYRADFCTINLQIQTNLICAAWKHDIKKLLFIASSCMYPRECQQPMKESYLWSGPVEPTNSPFAVAKLAGIEMCRAYHDQHGSHFFGMIPSNLFGQNDNYHSQDSHVMAALISKIHTAKVGLQPKVVLWGTGTPRRELLYVDDLARAAVLLMERFDDPEPINVGFGSDHSIREIAETVCAVIGYQGALEFDATKPDGVARKLLDSTRIASLGWKPETGLRQGIERAYADYLQRFPDGKTK